MKAAALAFLVLGLGAGSAAAQQGDPIEGESDFRRCMACHMIGEGATHKIGPVLNDAVGRQAGTAPGFSYSLEMVKQGKKGLVWTEETLDRWLTNPRQFIEGTRMSFAGVADAQDRANIIAYLATFSPGYVPQPD